MKRFLRRTTLPASFALVLLVVGCPQFFVYDLQQASINHETIETAPLLAAGAPQFTATPVLGGAAVAIPDGNPTFSTDQIINLTSATEGATIHYVMTTDDSEPTDPNPYANSLTKAFNPNSPFVASGDGRTIKLRAITLKAQAYPSEYVNRQFTISYSTTDSPVFSPAAGTYTGELSVVLSSAGADIWYALTTDGTDPGAPAIGSSSLYSGPITVTGQAWIRAIAVAPQKRVSGEVVAQYFVGPEAPTVQSVGAPPLWYDIAGFAVGGSNPTFQALPGAGSNAGFRAKIDAPPGTTATAQAGEYDFDSIRTIPLTTPGNYALYVRQRGTGDQWSAATKFPFQIYNVIRVDSTGDVISADGKAILREAIVAAESDALYKDATTGRADVMDLIDMRGFPVSTVTLTSPLPALSKSTIIVADPGTVRIDGASLYRIFTITGGVVVIDNLALKQGVARGQNGANGGVDASGGGGAAGMGGAVYVNGNTASVFITNVTFSNNQAFGGAGGSHGSLFVCDAVGGDGAGPLGGAGGAPRTPGMPGGFGSGGGGGGSGCSTAGGGGDGGFGGGGGGGGARRGGGTGASGGLGGTFSFGGAGGIGCCSGPGGGGGGAALGGAIFVYQGSLDVSDSTFNANVATGGPGGANYSSTLAGFGRGKGGAIFVAAGANFTQSGLVFNSNVASSAAGTANDNNDIYDGS